MKRKVQRPPKPADHPMPRKATSKDYLMLANNVAFVEILDEIQSDYFDAFRAALNDEEAINLSNSCHALEELIAQVKLRAKEKLKSVPDPAA